MGRYGVKEIFLTLQGEGVRAGTKAVFARLSGCNLWDGHPLHRDSGVGACSKWCDSDFFKGSVMSTDEVLGCIGDLWPPFPDEDRWVVLTGGEPCLQLDADLLQALTDYGWKIAIETNGTVENSAVVQFAHHICIAPKLGNDGKALALELGRAHEIKVVLPGRASGRAGWSDADLLALEAQYPDARLFVQPQDPLWDDTLVEETALVRKMKDREDPGDPVAVAEREAQLDEQLRRNIQQCIRHALRRPRWSLSMQLHKFVGLR